MQPVQHDPTDGTENPEVSHVFFNFVSRLRMLRTGLTEEVWKSPPVIPRTGDLTGGEEEPGHHRRPST